MWDVSGFEECMCVDFVVDLLIKIWFENDDKFYEEKFCECIFGEVVDVYK